MGNKKGLLKSILPWLIVLMVISVAIPFFNQSESVRNNDMISL